MTLHAVCVAGFFYIGNKATKEILGGTHLFLREYFLDRKLCENDKMLELCDISVGFFYYYGDYYFPCGNI